MPGGPRNTITSLNVATKEFATRWPTATASDASFENNPRNGIKGNHNLSLNNAAGRWATPAARDHKGANGPEHMASRDRPHMDQLANQVEHAFPLGLPDPTATGAASPQDSGPRRLNPAFVEWLMMGGGLQGWTDFAPLETGSFRRWLRAHSLPSPPNS